MFDTKPTRRQFLRQTAGAAALATLPFSLRAENSGPSLGFSLYGMKSIPLAEALEACARIGYRNVEFALNKGFPAEPKQLSTAARKEIRSRLQTLHLETSALMINIGLVVDDATHAKNLEEIKAAAQLAHDLVPEHPPLVETVLGGKPAEWENAKDKMAERLQAWAATASAGGISVAIKAHVNNAVNSPERLLWLLQKVNNPAIVATYDHSHFEVQGMALAESMKLLLPHTKFIHVKDAVMEGKNARFLLPGEGRTDYATYFKLLKQHGYHGPVVVEVSAQVFNKPGYEPLAAAKKCHAALSAAMAQV